MSLIDLISKNKISQLEKYAKAHPDELNKVSQNGTACTFAAASGKTDALKKLIKLGAKLDNSDSNSISIWHACVTNTNSNKYAEIIKIVERTLNTTIKENLNLISSIELNIDNVLTKFHANPVFYAAFIKNWDFIEDLLDQNISLNVNFYCKEKGYSLAVLLFTSNNGLSNERRDRIIDKIYANGESFNLDVFVESKICPFSTYLLVNDFLSLQKLLARPETICNLEIFRFFSYSALKREAVQKFNFNSIPPDFSLIFIDRDKKTKTLALRLCEINDLEVIIRYVDHNEGTNLDFNFTNSDCKTPFWHLVQNEQFDLINRILDRGIYLDCDASPQYSEPILQTLINKNQLNLVKRLIQHAEFVLIKNTNDESELLKSVLTCFENDEDFLQIYVDKAKFNNLNINFDLFLTLAQKPLLFINQLLYFMSITRSHIASLTFPFSPQTAREFLFILYVGSVIYDLSDALRTSIDETYGDKWLLMDEWMKEHSDQIIENPFLFCFQLKKRYDIILSPENPSHNKLLFLLRAELTYQKAIEAYNEQHIDDHIDDFFLNSIWGNNVKSAKRFFRRGLSDYSILTKIPPNRPITPLEGIFNHHDFAFFIEVFNKVLDKKAALTLFFSNICYLLPEKFFIDLLPYIDSKLLFTSCKPSFFNGVHFRMLFESNALSDAFILEFIERIDDQDLTDYLSNNEDFFSLFANRSREIAGLLLSKINDPRLIQNYEHKSLLNWFSKYSSYLDLDPNDSKEVIFSSLCSNSNVRYLFYTHNTIENSIFYRIMISGNEKLINKVFEGLSQADLSNSHIQPIEAQWLLLLCASMKNWRAINLLLPLANEKALESLTVTKDNLATLFTKSKKWIFLAELSNKVSASKILSFQTVAERNEWVQELIKIEHPALDSVLLALDFSRLKTIDDSIVSLIFTKSISSAKSQDFRDKVLSLKMNVGKEFVLYHYHLVFRDLNKRDLLAAKEKLEQSKKHFLTYSPHEDLFKTLESNLKAALEDDMRLKADLVAVKAQIKSLLPAQTSNVNLAIAAPVGKKAPQALDGVDFAEKLKNEHYLLLQARKKEEQENKKSKNIPLAEPPRSFEAWFRNYEKEEAIKMQKEALVSKKPSKGPLSTDKPKPASLPAAATSISKTNAFPLFKVPVKADVTKNEMTYVVQAIKILDELRTLDSDLDRHFDDEFYVNAMTDSCFRLCSTLGLFVKMTSNKFMSWRHFFRHEHKINKDHIKYFLNQIGGLEQMLKGLEKNEVYNFDLIAAPSFTTLNKDDFQVLREVLIKHIENYAKVDASIDCKMKTFFNQRNRGSFFRVGSILRDIKNMGCIDQKFYVNHQSDLQKINNVIHMCNVYAHESSDDVVIKYSDEIMFSMTGENLLSLDAIEEFMEVHSMVILRMLGR